MASIVQRPTPPNEWLHNGAPDYTRMFRDYIIRPDTAPAWAECTNEEKKEFERTHPAPEPELNEQDYGREYTDTVTNKYS